MYTFRTEHTGRRSKYALEDVPADWEGYLLDPAETKRIQQAIDGLVGALSAAGDVAGEAWLLREELPTGVRVSLRASRRVAVFDETGATSGQALLQARIEGASWPRGGAAIVLPLARRTVQWPTFDLADPGTHEEFSFVLVGGSHAVLTFANPGAAGWGPTLVRGAMWAAGLLVDALVAAWETAGANAAACDAVGGLRWLNPDNWAVSGDASRVPQPTWSWSTSASAS